MKSTFQIKWGDTLLQSVSDEYSEKAKVIAYNLAQLYCIFFEGEAIEIVEVVEDEQIQA